MRAALRGGLFVSFCTRIPEMEFIDMKDGLIMKRILNK